MSSATTKLAPQPAAVLRQITREARTWRERVADHRASGCDCNADPLDTEPWRQLVGKGDAALFDKRLLWEGLERAALEAALACSTVPTPAANSTPPAWTKLIEQVLELAPSHVTEPLVVPEHVDHPFIELLLPMLGVARAQLAQGLRLPLAPDGTLPATQTLASTAWWGLEKELLKKLAIIASRPLEQLFSLSKPIGAALLNRVLTGQRTSCGRTHYDRFISDSLSDGLRQLFTTFPVLARLVATLMQHWVESTLAFTTALQADLPELKRLFGGGPPAGPTTSDCWQVVSITSGLSDAHAGGQTVKILTFGSGLRLVWKPRSVGLAQWFYGLVQWCSKRWNGPPLRKLVVLNKDSHGWVEHIDPADCGSEAEIAQYFERVGGLLCLLYVVGGNDVHFENIIAAGAQPMLIDLETLLQPSLAEFGDGVPTVKAALESFTDSVLRTGLLPRWRVSPDAKNKEAMDHSGLGQAGSASSASIAWKEKGTDAIHWIYEIPPNQGLKLWQNLPVLDGNSASPAQHLDMLKLGFCNMYQVMLDHETSLAKNFWSQCRNHHVRVLFRNTNLYVVILQVALAPEHLKCGLRFSWQLEGLCQGFLKQPEPPRTWPIAKAEQLAMQQLDVPCFRTTADSFDLTQGLPSPLTGCIGQSGFQLLEHRLARLGPEDLGLQLAIIEGSFAANQAQTVNESSHLEPLSYVANTAAHSSRGSSLTDAAIQIGDRLLQLAIHSQDGSLSWLGLQYLPIVGRLQLQVLGNDLFDGNGGIALFLAALAKVTGDPRYRDAALRALIPLQESVRDAQADGLPDQVNIGGAIGLGSMIYSLARVSALLEEPALLETSLAVLELLSTATLEDDDKFDVFIGAAGTTLAVLALHGLSGNGRCLEVAYRCGAHLLASRVQSSHGCHWLTTEGHPQSGFSHGAAGIAYALVRLFEATNNEVYVEVAREAIAFETGLFSASEKNWSMFPPGTEDVDRYAPNWCNGAPGVGLARLGCWQSLPCPNDVDAALAHVRSGRTLIDHPCCGNAGRIETQLVAAERLKRPELHALARETASWMVSRAQLAGGYKLRTTCSFWNPTLFQGTAGIGYQLLRVEHPDLPSVLLWE